MEDLKLKRITDEDVKLIESWLRKDYIIKWFSDADEWLHEVKNRDGEFSFISHFIVMNKERTIGFCQYYKCVDAKEEWYGDTVIDGAYSMDYLIGEEEFIGKGLGKEIIRLLNDEIFSLPDSKMIILKPEEDNKPSCNALLANGFLFNSEYRFYFKRKISL